MHSWYSTVAPLVLVLLATGCTDYAERTQVVVLIDADGSVRERIHSVDVDVQIGTVGGDKWQPWQSRPYVPSGSRGWPIELSLIRTEAEAETGYRVIATARDASGETITSVRVVSGYVPGRTRELVLRFDAACAARQPQCSEQFSCSNGKCVSPVVSPTDLPAREGPGELPAVGGPQAPGTGTPAKAPECPGMAACVSPTSPCADHGGCDPLVRCTSMGDKAVCEDCPEGFAGDSRSGCIPVLIGLEISRGELSPDFSPEATDYSIELPLVGESLLLTPRAAQDVSVRIEGELLAHGASWRVPILRRGDNRVVLTLSSTGHESRTYTVNARRDGREVGYVRAGNPDADDTFGHAIALEGDTLVVGAPQEDGSGAGVNPAPNDALADSGAVYVFVQQAGEWREQAYLKSGAPVENAHFGNSVALSGDRIAVGADDDSAGGSVHIFERQGEIWQLAAVLHPDSNAGAAMFGSSVALQGDRLAVGAVSDDLVVSDSGAVYVFEREPGAPDASAWMRKARLKAGNAGPLDWLGTSVALEGDLLVSGATGVASFSGEAHVFAPNDGTWEEVDVLTPTPPVTSAFAGESVSISGDSIVVGTFGGTANLTGVVHTFTRGSDGRYVEEQALRASNASNGDYFGDRVALQGDTLVVGAQHESSAGMGVGVAPSGNLANSGAAYVYTRERGSWRELVLLKASRPSANDEFGFNVAMSGELIAVSAVGDTSGSGAVYLFR